MAAPIGIIRRIGDLRTEETVAITTGWPNSHLVVDKNHALPGCRLNKLRRFYDRIIRVHTMPTDPPLSEGNFVA